ncbi:substrate-binding domain-containing protein [Mycolicibacterium tokaiense]|uniref:von Willebrand factor, type A n=1 Tax=Mycolicibacterium tokaiense TaxID=39695 RepID=A0A378TP10_9MYCO|nr:substrate-binding domain-containing protein [Mycolicibacterium tokaiense]BBY89112.1 hypothetical protein MTOK_48940 [Mycolicibacterium tokaiense]STZ62501.1 von Willebrand factor, type A [Mycolicibacterium tokaiense]
MGRHSKPGPDDDDDVYLPPQDSGFDDAQFDDDEIDPDERYRAEPTSSTTDDRSVSDQPDNETTAVIRTSGQLSGGHRNAGEWTGSHRTVAPGRRGVSVGVIAALVTVVVVVGAVILWRFFGAALDSRRDAAAANCLEGEMTVSVVADPAIADPLGPLAERFNGSASPVGDHCVKIAIQSADSDAVIDGISGQWPSDLGGKPALWIPGSSVSPARLSAAVNPQTISASTSLVTSPVVLAIRPELKPAVENEGWAALPGLQSRPDSIDLPGWGSLRLALPTVDDSDAAYLAAEAVAAGAPAGDGAAAVRTLRSGQPELPDPEAGTAMSALLDADNPADAPVHAVATTEQQLFTRSTDLPDAAATVTAWMPNGPTPVADFPAVLLDGDWLSDEQVSAASQFERFLRQPEQQQELRNAGFRTTEGTPPGNDVTPFGEVSAAPAVDDQQRVDLADALTAPAASPVVTIMLDRSLDLEPVRDALKARIAALAPTAVVGLTTFDGASGSTAVAPGPLSEDAPALTAALDGLTTGSSGAVSFTTLRNVITDARSGYRPDQPNSVLVITAGPHTDQSLGAEGLQDLVRAGDPARAVAVNVINVGDDPDRPTWEAVAEISGGTYENVPNTSAPEFAAAVDTLLN